VSERGIIIVGGGPVGLALALLLARREVSSTVIDARGLEVARSDQRLLALARGTVDLLRPLLDLPQEACAPIRTVVVSSAGEFGRVVIREDDLGIGPLGVTVRYGASVQMQEVTSQSSYLSVNDTRLHFGLGAAAIADIEIRWPLGKIEKLASVAAGQLVVVTEGAGITRTQKFQ